MKKLYSTPLVIASEVVLSTNFGLIYSYVEFRTLYRTL